MRVASPGEAEEDIVALLETMQARLLYPPESLASAFKSQIRSTATLPEVVAGTETGLLVGILSRMEKDAKQAQRKGQRTGDFQPVKDISNCIKLFRSIGWGDTLMELLQESVASSKRGVTFGSDFDACNEAIVQIMLQDEIRRTSSGAAATAASGESPVLRAVKRRLASAVESGDDFRAIVFVPTIDAAYCMQRALSEIARAEVLLGQVEQTKRMQTDVVADFHAGKFSVLVATSVAEEGLDIQKCNLVIRTEQPQSIISNIQARGRARQKDAQYVVECLDADEVEEVEYLSVREDAAEQIISEMLASGDADFASEDGAGTNWSQQTAVGVAALRGNADDRGDYITGPLHVVGAPPSYTTVYGDGRSETGMPASEYTELLQMASSSSPSSRSGGGGGGGGSGGGGNYGDDAAVDDLFDAGMAGGDASSDSEDDDGAWRDYKSNLNTYLQQQLRPDSLRGIVAKYPVSATARRSNQPNV